MRSYISVFLLLLLHCLFFATAAISLEAHYLRSLFHFKPLHARVDSGLPPKPDSNGICFQYAVQEADTCQSIAEAHQLTVADIESYSAAIWGWKGCANIQQGNFLCLSSGAPVMPVALPHAICGPQVPGTARPDNYAILSTLNPCPAGECCTKDGLCVPSDSCTADNCIADCKAATIRASAQPEPEKTAKVETNVPVQTTAQGHTTTETKHPQTTHEPETTTEDEPPAKTIEVEGPAWTLTAYTWLQCDGDYLVFVGHKDVDGKCIDIHGGLNSDISTTGVSCRYYWDGGANSSDCDSSPSLGIYSWSLTGGKCTAFHQRCDNSGRDQVKISPKVGCQASLMRRPNYYMHWGSVQCEVA